MIIEVPNGADTSSVCLTEVLYSPEISYTLVSIGCIDNAGCTATFGQGLCTIMNTDGSVMGQIPKNE
ncbi:hypothetical protein ID866_10650 [Astraeus odoratus]|nr:hypothetical protein ID866_10650 [Astraeus odoratus]